MDELFELLGHVPWRVLAGVIAGTFIGGLLLFSFGAGPWTTWALRALGGLVILLALWVLFIRTLRRQRESEGQSRAGSRFPSITSSADSRSIRSMGRI